MRIYNSDLRLTISLVAQNAIAQFLNDKFDGLPGIRYELEYDLEFPDDAKLNLFDEQGNSLWVPVSNDGKPRLELRLDDSELKLAAWEDERPGHDASGDVYLGTIEEGYQDGVFCDEDVAA